MNSLNLIYIQLTNLDLEMHVKPHISMIDLNKIMKDTQNTGSYTTRDNFRHSDINTKTNDNVFNWVSQKILDEDDQTMFTQEDQD